MPMVLLIVNVWKYFLNSVLISIEVCLTELISSKNMKNIFPIQQIWGSSSFLLEMSFTDRNVEIISIIILVW